MAVTAVDISTDQDGVEVIAAITDVTQPVASRPSFRHRDVLLVCVDMCNAKSWHVRCWCREPPTQPPTLSGTRNEYRPNRQRTVMLCSLGVMQDGSFHFWINVWDCGWQVKLCDPVKHVTS